MLCRHLHITLYDNGDVGYDFYRHGAKKWSRYRIDYPSDRVRLLDQEQLMASGARLSNSPTHVQLDWPEGGDPDQSIRYEKTSMMQSLGRGYWRYRDEISVKGGDGVVFSLQLHGIGLRLSAVHRQSHATMNGRIFLPRELANIQFSERGTLCVDWVLDPGLNSSNAYPRSRLGGVI